MTGDCPVDSFVNDLTTCSEDAAQMGLSYSGVFQGMCASGMCTSRDLQCQLKGTLSGITKECPGYSDQCQMYCQGRDTSVCTQITGFFSDGTACSFGGKCMNGMCQVEGLNALIGWFGAHMAIGISLLISVLLIVGICIYQCCSRWHQSKQAHASVRNTQLSQQHGYPAEIFLSNHQGQARRGMIQSSSTTGLLQQSASSQSLNASANGWVDPAQYNGAYNPDNLNIAALGVASPPLPPIPGDPSAPDISSNFAHDDSVPPISSQRKSSLRRNQPLPSGNGTAAGPFLPPSPRRQSLRSQAHKFKQSDDNLNALSRGATMPSQPSWTAGTSTDQAARSSKLRGPPRK